MKYLQNVYENTITFLSSSVPKAVLFIIFGYFLARLISKTLVRTLQSRLTLNQTFLLKKFTFYIILFIFVFSALQELGFNFNVLLGATGILTVAFGIASQTSMSNIVSGIFIIGEKPFQIGNVVKINDIQGEVMSIDFLSVKIKTDDNTMVRVPNELLIKSSIVNLSYFSNRRIAINIRLSSAVDLKNVKKILLETASKQPLCLKEPRPEVNVNILENCIEVQLTLWCKREDNSRLKNAVQQDIQHAFVKAKIDLSYNKWGMPPLELPSDKPVQ